MDDDKLLDNNIDSTKKTFVSDELRRNWSNEQIKLRTKLITHDTEEWQKSFNENLDIKQNPGLRFVAGLDLSFIKGNDDTACAGLVILDVLDNLKVIYEDISMVDLTQPYVPGYLAFREAPCLVDKLNKLKTARPEIYPQCLFIDGNGILHPKRFGLACHLGVLTDTPSIGIAKRLFKFNGIMDDAEQEMKVKKYLVKKNDYFEINSNVDSELFGYCYLMGNLNENNNIVYISPGHRMSCETCLKLIKSISNSLVSTLDDPTRQADLRTRKFILDKHPNVSKATIKVLDQEMGLKFRWNKTVLVMNIPFNAKWYELRNLFSAKVGDVKYCEIFSKNGKSIGIGAVEFETEENARRAVEIMNNFQIRGRYLCVSIDESGFKTRTILETKLKEREVQEQSCSSNEVNMMLKRKEHVFEWKNTIYIDNLSYSVKKKDLENLLIKNRFHFVYLILFEKSGKPFAGTIEFQSSIDAKTALNFFNESSFQGRKLYVSLDINGNKTNKARSICHSTS